MKTNRNDSCPCGSGKKYKNCHENKAFLSGDGKSFTRWFTISALALFLGFFLWGLIEFFATDHPEMEAYKCDNLNCGQIHYRVKTESN